MSFYKELKGRGLVSQVTHPEQASVLLDGLGCTVYTGFDPTADSLHVGHLIPIMGLARAQRAGHRPIALVGGGTALIGDPSGKSEMRRMLTRENIDDNLNKIKTQLSRFIDFAPGKALVLNNLDWLGQLRYLDILRDVGAHFSVNRMLTADCFKARMESGLSFIEFNYMILQAYDFLHLFREYQCKVQLGGDDQWSNMLAGADLIRRVEQGDAYAVTYPLLTTADGKKMGKTEKGAVWLDAEKTSPYEYYQFWRNVPDDRVGACLNYFTFLPEAEVARLSALQGAELNGAKEILAYEATVICHGRGEADQSRQAAQAAFGGGESRAAMPSTEIALADVGEGLAVTELLKLAGMAASNNEGRRLIKGGGVYLDGVRVDDQELKVTKDQLTAGVELRKGKKAHHIFKGI